MKIGEEITINKPNKIKLRGENENEKERNESNL